METSLIYWIILITIVLEIPIFIFVFKMMAKKSKKHAELLGGLAHRKGGMIVKSKWKLYPSLVIGENQLRVSFISGNKNSAPRTVGQCALKEGNEFECTIYKEHSLHKIVKMIGMKDLKMNNPEFDESFIIQGKDEFRMRSFLIPEIQKGLLDLKQHHPYLRVRKNEFYFCINTIPDNEIVLEKFVDTAKMLTDKLNQL